MIRYYILLFVRNFMRQRLFSFINLLGLTVSIASTLLIYLYVRHELSYDSFHPNLDRLYRVNQTFIWADNRDAQFSRTGPGVAHALNEELPEVEMTTSFHTPGNFILSYTKPDQEIISFEEDRIFAADSNFFKLLNFPLVKGDADNALRNANTVVMTRSTAQRYFGSADPIGKQVRVGNLKGGNQNTFEVTGVVEDTPDHSTIQFDILLSMRSFPEVERNHWSWIWTQLETFVLLRENATADEVRSKFPLLTKKRVEETLQRAMNVSYDEYIKSGKKWDLYLQPVSTMHLPEHEVIGSFPDVGNIKTIYSLVGAAIFIVLLSCINFMNLSTAQFARRIKEASVRKVLGMAKEQLSLNYFLEALIFCLLAVVLALAVTQALLPLFNILSGKKLTMPLFSDPLIGIGLLLLAMFMAILSSSYPSLYLSRFNPIQAMKGKLKVGREGKLFRNGLVIFQFAISIVLVTCTVVVFQQLNYFSEKDLGFDKENLIEVDHLEELQNPESFAKESMQIPGATASTWCASTPPRIFGGDSFTAEGLNGRTFSLNYTSADEQYIPTLGIQLKLGRNFSESNPEDRNRVIVNETLLKSLGWNVDESVLGKKIQYPNSGSEETSMEIIGVASDFNYWSLDVAIEPMAIFHIKNEFIPQDKQSFLALRIAPQSSEAWEKTIAALQQLWKKHAGDTPFEYGFVDEFFAETFKTQQQFGNVLTIMASLAILIASLGLLGMIIYALEQRTKEIGIRKVSGASVWNILMLISKSYASLILIAFIIATPVAKWILDQWLNDFAHRISPSPFTFIVIGLSTFAIAILITSYHSVKAAKTNPVDVLRDE